MTTDNIQDAHALFSDPPPLPEPTASVAPAAAAPVESDPATQAPADPSAPVDSKGVPFDPALHQTAKGQPRKRKDGSWWPKGGGALNARHRAKGVQESFLAPPPRQSAPGMENPAGGLPGHSDGTTPGQTITPDVETNPDPSPLTPAEAKATGVSITAVTFGALRLGFGPVWNSTPEETKTWRDFWERVALSTGLRMPLWIEGLTHAITSVASRVSNPDPTTRWGRIVCKITGKEVIEPMQTPAGTEGVRVQVTTPEPDPAPAPAASRGWLADRRAG